MTNTKTSVAPHAGAWSETLFYFFAIERCSVVPYAGGLRA